MSEKDKEIPLFARMISFFLITKEEYDKGNCDLDTLVEIGESTIGLLEFDGVSGNNFLSQQIDTIKRNLIEAKSALIQKEIDYSDSELPPYAQEISRFMTILSGDVSNIDLKELQKVADRVVILLRTSDDLDTGFVDSQIKLVQKALAELTAESVLLKYTRK